MKNSKREASGGQVWCQQPR